MTDLGRLKRRAEFLRVRNGLRFVTAAFVLEARQRADAGPSDPPKFGFTASRKVGGAVVRNRARRRLKEAVRLHAEGAARPGFDYVLIARAGTLQRRFADLVEDLRLALDRIHRPRGRPLTKRKEA